MSTYRRMLRYLAAATSGRTACSPSSSCSRSARIESSVPFLIKFTFDQVFTKQRAETLPSRGGCGPRPRRSLRGGVGFVADYLNDWIGQRVVTDMRNELTTHLQQLDLAFFNRQRAGQIVSRVTADVTLVRSSRDRRRRAPSSRTPRPSSAWSRSRSTWTGCWP